MSKRDLTTLRLQPDPRRERPPLDYYMAQAHIAWARRYRPWLLRKVA